MRKRISDEARYLYRVRLEQQEITEFIENEELETNYLVSKYKRIGVDMPFEIYRTCAFFLNKEYKMKLGSLSLLMQTNENLKMEMPETTKENCIEQIYYKYKMYSKVLEQGDY
jgi:hypothetical protein